MLEPFSDPQAVARYAEGPVRQVPGFHALQRMAGLLLAERVPEDGHVLVLGAGGGLELKAFAEVYPGWRFCGVDPSAEMLGLAGQTLGPLASRVEMHEGYIDTAPSGPFDAAACLLTLHFIPEDERRLTVAEVHRRLAPGAPLVVAHHSFPQDEDEKLRWLARYAAFAAASGHSCAGRQQGSRCHGRAPAAAVAGAGRGDLERRRVHRYRLILRRFHLPRLGRIQGIAARLGR
jgi:tRNA (cmo5U34)-methyltransferase